MPLYDDLAASGGKTPLVRLHRLPMANKCVAYLFGKQEYMNPTSSVKDRIAKAMLQTAEFEGSIYPNHTTLVEPTSGNTGIGLAMIAAFHNYELILTMPDSMTIERRGIIRAYGAKLQLTPGIDGMIGAINLAEEIVEVLPNSYSLQQFTNPTNPDVHAATTAEEIWADTNGQIDCFICAIGTGGTITGCGRVLKARNPDIKIIGVEPATSPFVSKGIRGVHGLQGIGAGFMPDVLDQSIMDEIITITDQEAMGIGRLLSFKEGLFIGISSGATVAAALQVGSRLEMKGKNLVVILASSGERYLSSPMFNGSDEYYGNFPMFSNSQDCSSSGAELF
uniref:Cysteine synthase n=1 Tax=Paulinella chromatophora TaxID=39717 RepID=B1X471_PAUCH|nr:cysteine synthase A [Paulinella chromatophora]ACB42740.1 cysteine synthase A [Paulinella chromatophora]|eukprot:gb/GEZN01004508.1/.p1 GENE.gb/GEZN01004508.1/~~gb/GEZN01004508.1/.p1  ORF type:complete len:336 (+),score=-2.20 gb/GEZN01004508.1/:384-1391(+)